MSVNSFLRQNKKESKIVELVVSENFIDKEGKPEVWKLKKVNAARAELIQEQCMDPVPNAKAGEPKKELNAQKYMNGLIAESVVYPNLRSEELQKSYGTYKDVVGTLNEMLDYDEKNTLSAKISEMYHIGENTLAEKADEAKNE